MEQALTAADPDDATSSGPAWRIRALTDAAVAIHAPTDVIGVLRALGEHAGRIIGAPRVVVSLTHPAGDGPGERWAQTSIQVLADDAEPEELPDACLEPLFTAVCEEGSPLRLTADELSARPDRPTSRGPHLPDGSWLAAPLVARDGSNLGLVQLCGGEDDTFTEVDQALLVQLAQVASIAIEKSRLQAELAAQQASRFREELLSGISHDMQTPLAAIVGLAEMMATEPPSEDERAEIHQTIARQARSLRGLVQQFLDFTRIQSDRPLLVRPRPTDVVAAVDRVVSLFEHRRELVVGVSQNLPEAMVDPDRLDQILANLVSNAIKYSEAPIRVVARDQQDRIVVDVVDEGPGIEDDELERVFDKFQRGRTAVGTSGTGLGLYITRALVETQGAELSVHTSPGVGSRFSVSMPAV